MGGEVASRIRSVTVGRIGWGAGTGEAVRPGTGRVPAPGPRAFTWLRGRLDL